MAVVSAKLLLVLIVEVLSSIVGRSVIFLFIDISFDLLLSNDDCNIWISFFAEDECYYGVRFQC